MESETVQLAPSGIRIYLNHRRSLAKTGLLLVSWITLVSVYAWDGSDDETILCMFQGFHLELIGPTMPFVAANINVDFNGMGSVLASRGAGYFASNILGIILQGVVRKHSYVVLVVAYLLAAFGTNSDHTLRIGMVLFCFSDVCHSVRHVPAADVCAVFPPRSCTGLHRSE